VDGLKSAPEKAYESGRGDEMYGIKRKTAYVRGIEKDGKYR
jgi:hypothetical protein